MLLLAGSAAADQSPGEGMARGLLPGGEIVGKGWTVQWMHTATDKSAITDEFDDRVYMRCGKKTTIMIWRRVARVRGGRDYDVKAWERAPGTVFVEVRACKEGVCAETLASKTVVLQKECK